MGRWRAGGVLTEVGQSVHESVFISVQTGACLKEVRLTVAQWEWTDLSEAVSSAAPVAALMWLPVTAPDRRKGERRGRGQGLDLT